MMTEKQQDKIPGGLADEMSPEQFDRKALLKGLKSELEHTDDPQIALEIAMDHLVEDPDYYEKLESIHNEDKAGVKEPEDFETIIELSGSNHLAIVDAAVVKKLDVPGAKDAVFIPTKTSTEQPSQFRVTASYDDASLRNLTLEPVAVEISDPQPTNEGMGGVSSNETKPQRDLRKHTTLKGLKRNENERDAAGGSRGPRFDLPDPEKRVKHKVKRATSKKQVDLNGVARTTYDFIAETKAGIANPSDLEDKYAVRALLSDLMGICVGRIEHESKSKLDFDVIYEAWKSVDELIKDSKMAEIIKIEESINKGLGLV